MSLYVNHVVDDDDQERKRGQVEVFEIELLNCHDNVYHPGQYVVGHVTLHTNRPVLSRGILVTFCGRSAVHWTEKQRGRGAKCVDIVPFDSQEEFFHVTVPACEPGLIKAGSHEFPFRFHLVPPLPENYKDNICRVEYFVEARLKQDTNTKRDLKHRHRFQVSDPTDLNTVILPDVTLPVHTEKTLRPGWRCCPDPPLCAYLGLSRSGYTPGEIIVIQADLESNGKTAVKDVVFTLYQEREYITKYKTHTTRDDITDVSMGPLRPGQTLDWGNIPLDIPKFQLFNVSNSNIFGIRYFLEMKVLLGSRGKALVLSLEVILGAIPFKMTTLKFGPHTRLGATGRQQKPRHTSEFERRISQPAPSKQLQRHHVKDTENDRRRRKDRNRKVYPTDDVIDTSGYVEKR